MVPILVSKEPKLKPTFSHQNIACTCQFVEKIRREAVLKSIISSGSRNAHFKALLEEFSSPISNY